HTAGRRGSGGQAPAGAPGNNSARLERNLGDTGDRCRDRHDRLLYLLQGTSELHGRYGTIGRARRRPLINVTAPMTAPHSAGIAQTSTPRSNTTIVAEAVRSA